MSKTDSEVIQWFKDGPPSKTSDYEIIQWSNTYANNWERDWQVGEIILSLLEFARHSLVELDLTRNSSEEEQSAKEALEHAQLCRDDRCGVYKDVKPHRYESDSTVKLFIGSLRGFQVLKYIRAQNEMFVEEDSVNAAGGGKVHRLVDLLPASVKMIALAKPRLSWEDSYQLLEGLPELKAIVVPKLELIEFEIDKHNRTIPNSHVRLRFQAVGVELIL